MSPRFTFMIVAALILMGLLPLSINGTAWSDPVSIDVEAKPAKKLSDYGFFKLGGQPLEPNDRVIPYDINSPLFSDYTAKYRHVWVPEGTTITYDEREPFAFPVGSVILKTFAYLNDIRDPSLGQRILETRLLVHTSKGWKGYPYVWNEEQSEAVLKVAGTTVDAEGIHYDGTKLTNNYIIPNMNQCKSCHEQDGVLLPLGPKARNLNKKYDYIHGVEHQISFWTRIGLLEGAPENIEDMPRLAEYDNPHTGSLDDRARAWLENNCMHCHNPKGAANTTGYDLTYDVRDSLAYGIMKPPVAAGRGAGNRLFDIVPGKPDESILLYRLESMDPGVMMPELPRRLVHTESVDLIREWIEKMEMPGDVIQD